MITREIERGNLLADRYRVIRRLGAGGMATVWLAEDERLGRDVAIKLLRTSAPEESLTRFRREARVGATLNHPNFVSVFDTLADDEGALIVMEYVPGRSLQELAERGPMEPEKVVSILRGAAAALDHAHSEGVVHRDIKPANILIREDGVVKVADLGIARATDATQITAEGDVIGTVPYMAPERFERAGAGGPASDVYALAAVAYELLSGTPLDAATTGRRGQPPDRGALSAGWAAAPKPAFAAILRGLSRDPSQRQSSAGELVDELADAFSYGVATRPLNADRFTRGTSWPPFEPPAVSRSRRSRLRAVMALTLVVLAGLAAAGIALVGGDSSGGPSNKKQATAAGEGGGSGDRGGDSAAASNKAPAEESGATPSPSSGDGAGLNAEGFSLIQEGRPAEAVPVLFQAVVSFPEGTTDLDYAYALYNLGHALRLSGRPEQAIGVLERRLRIPNQRATVAAELERARADAGTD